MTFVLFEVTADLIQPTKFCIGVGSTCNDRPAAEQVANQLRKNRRYTNVKIEERRYGLD